MLRSVTSSFPLDITYTQPDIEMNGSHMSRAQLKVGASTFLCIIHDEFCQKSREFVTKQALSTSITVPKHFCTTQTGYVALKIMSQPDYFYVYIHVDCCEPFMRACVRSILLADIKA
jgi:hypothetical protein